MASKSKTIFEGQPSIIPPIAVPCDSPKVVTTKFFPKEFPAIICFFKYLIASLLAVFLVASNNYLPEKNVGFQTILPDWHSLATDVRCSKPNVLSGRCFFLFSVRDFPKA